MKKLTLLLGGLIASSAFAQLSVPIPMEVIVANGGAFETMPPFADRATIGTYDIQSGNYTTFDTIQVEGVQDLSVIHSSNGVGTGIYLAAQDSIVMYDGLYQRQNIVHFPSIKSVKAFYNENKVVAGKWFGTGDYVGVYDLNLNHEFSISDADIPYTIYDAAIIGDSLYVAYNFPSVIDNCPPYGCYEDSLGMIGVISLTSQSYVRSINLGTAAKGLKALSYVDGGSSFYAICEGGGDIFEHNPSTGVTNVMDTKVTKSLNELSFYGAFAYIDSAGVIAEDFSGTTNTGINHLSVTAGAFDFEESNLYYTETDFNNYGRLFKMNSSNTITDSVDVGISPEAIALRYDIVGGINDLEINARIYPNPSNGLVTIESQRINSIEVYSAIGKLVDSYANISSDRFRLELPDGLFFVRIKTEYGETTRKLIVR